MCNLEDVKKIREKSGLTQKQFAEICGVTLRTVQNWEAGKKIPDNIIRLIKTIAPQGEIISSSPSPIIETDSASGIPYYSEMPVSAGSADLQMMDGDERAVGYIRIAGVSGKCAFPVVGCSMEPVIHAGDIVVVDVLDRYELIDPDKIYMIVTADDRMIKHIETDESNPDILWCVSPNYRRFSIPKTDIRQIFKVTFYGRFV